jgi:enamine deaminase RidA (YjgF/YER057c/UK114 family)
VFRNIVACLREHKMRKSDLVKFTVFLTDPRYVEAYRAARKKNHWRRCPARFDLVDRRWSGVA